MALIIISDKKYGFDFEGIWTTCLKNTALLKEQNVPIRF